MNSPRLTVPGLSGLAVLARGGFATVYRAVQESVGREVAVKVENRTLSSERDRRRFLREARAAGRMSGHPHVVDLFDAGVTGGGHPYLIMELCSGSYLEISKATPLTAGQAREVGVKIADALADAHALGVLHRDVKPANILNTRFGEPVLADFGLAVLTEARDAAIALDVLTPAYAPPETFRQAEPGPGADVYALCATLYALMRGRPARWSEEREPSVVSMVDMFAELIPDVPGVPAELMDLLRAGMANNPARRPTASALRDALFALHLPPSAGSPPGGDAVIYPAVTPPSTEIRTFHGDHAASHGDATAPYGDMTALQRDIVALPGDVAALSRDVAARSGGIAALHSDVKASCGDVEVCHGDVAVLREDATAPGGEVAVLGRSVFPTSRLDVPQDDPNNPRSSGARRRGMRFRLRLGWLIVVGLAELLVIAGSVTFWALTGHSVFPGSPVGASPSPTMISPSSTSSPVAIGSPAIDGPPVVDGSSARAATEATGGAPFADATGGDSRASAVGSR